MLVLVSHQFISCASFDVSSFRLVSVSVRTLEIESPAAPFEGEFFVIVGPSGSGKSSLGRLVPRLFDACEGLGSVMTGLTRFRPQALEEAT